MRTDAEIRQDVYDELIYDPSVNEGEVHIDVTDGVVTLSGSVDSFSQRIKVAEDAERIRGVNVVIDHLDVVVPQTHARSDAYIADTVKQALGWNVEVPPNRVTARVNDGFVTLDGMVDWNHQKTAALTTVQYLAGVRGVTNNITLEPRPLPSSVDVCNHIVAALRRSAEVDPDSIQVDVDGSGTVTLRGIAHSWAERDDAERAAWAAPGVRRVDDQLIVTSDW